MPNCFQLVPKGGTDPQPLGAIDAQLVWHFRDDRPYNPWLQQRAQSENHEKRWFADWYNVIGWLLASGKSFAQIRVEMETWTDDAQYRALLVSICDYLQQHFTSDCWAEIGRR